MKKQTLAIFASSALLLLAFENCQKSRIEIINGKLDSSSQSNQLSLSNTINLFNKTPFLQANPSISIQLPLSETKLENNHFAVFAKDQTPLSKKEQSDQWPLRQNSFYYDDLAQYTTYYWANTAMEKIYQQTEINYLINHKINIQTKADSTGWDATLKTIYLEKGIDLDTGILIHLLGQANITFSQPNFSFEAFDADPQHLNCGPTESTIVPADCCRSQDGCSKAIISGAADYFVGLTFEEKPTLGEWLTQRESGLGFCGISRNLNSNLNLDLATTYNACVEATNVRGQINLMGAWYASVWWRIRTQLKSQQDLRNFDALYMRHLSLIRPEDNFQTIFSKVLDLDKKYYGGAFSDDFKKVTGW